MPFWSSGQVEPKRQFRFKVTIASMPDGAQFYARSATKPTFSITQSEHKFLNHTFYYPGKVSWNPVTISMVDPVAPDATGNLLSILRRSGYNVPSNLTEDDAFRKGNATAALGQVTIRALDENGDILEEWTLNNPFIVGLTMNDYTYEGEDLSTLDVELRYDWASYVIPADRAGNAGEDVIPRLFTPGGSV